MPVAIRPERRLRVVDVQRAQAVEADLLVDLVEQAVERRGIGDVVARRVQVARVEAEAEPGVPPEPVDDHRQLVDRAADRSAGARGVLDQEPRPAVARVERGLERGRDAIERRAESRAEMGADVEGDAVCVDRGRRLRRLQKRLGALLVEVLPVAAEVDQVERVDEHGAHAHLVAARAAGGEHLGVVIGEAPGARALDEELNRVRADLDGAIDRPLDAASAVGPEEHAVTLLPCPSAFAWPRARPVRSTSGASARRSSTGSSRVTRAASSASGSRTRTRAARSRTLSSRSATP